MKTTTSFDLNRAIQQWRENLGQSPAFRSENLYELETHLRDSIATLQRQGLSDEESFLVALKRIGKNGFLEAEFAKQNAQSIWLDRALWILLGAQVWFIVGNLTNPLQILFNLSLLRLNGWLETYGFGRIPESFAVGIFYVISFPVTLLVIAKALYVLHRWTQARGLSLVKTFLDRPLFLAGIYAILFVAPTVLSYGIASVAAKFNWQQYEAIPAFGSIPRYAVAAFLIVNASFFAAIVWMIAKRKLKLRRA